MLVSGVCVYNSVLKFNQQKCHHQRKRLFQKSTRTSMNGNPQGLHCSFMENLTMPSFSRKSTVYQLHSCKTAYILSPVMREHLYTKRKTYWKKHFEGYSLPWFQNNMAPWGLLEFLLCTNLSAYFRRSLYSRAQWAFTYPYSLFSPKAENRRLEPSQDRRDGPIHSPTLGSCFGLWGFLIYTEIGWR